ncbi:larval-specific very high density lipoprotein [Anoplolepis gracilipes]|uniref:larval-specific very high density lipoprotein n=1 Tax=Anoplolepis gracilipes TaxID=354296 RepID=UPI003BA0BD31
MNALSVLLLCLAAACAVPVHFPAEKTVTYNYYADVKTGIIEPEQYVSQFTLVGQLLVKKETSDPTLNNAYYVKLHNLKYGMYNGMVVDHQPVEAVQELGEAAQQIQEPFVIVYDDHGKFQGIQLLENESGWSKNMKQGIASMMQLDLAHIQLQTPMKPHSFVTHENTIHGTCQVVYDVYSANPENPETATNFVVKKLHDLRNCSHFTQRIFDHVECETCHVESMNDMTTAARRVFHIEQQNDDILIKRMVAHSVINYFPFNAQSEAHYILTNTTLDLHSMTSPMETPMSITNFKNVPMIRDITFNKPIGNYALHAAEDLTHGRHIVKLDALIPKLKKMLVEAADYLEENHLEAKEPEWKHGQTINRLQHTMNYMDLGSLEQVFNAIQDAKTPKEVTMKNIFLQMVPTVGTTAACHFTRNVIRKHKVTDATAMAMLVKLPMYVKVPSERLLLEMEELLKLDNTVSSHIKKASILCFSILIRKTFMHQQDEIVNPLLQRYLHRFLDHVKNDQSYEMKMVYLMAMKNVQVGNIEKLLEPIIRGEIIISENPHHIRVQSIWAIKKAVADKVEYTHNLLWPILADVTQPLVMRIVAYDVLISQMPNMQRIMNIYWLMVHEQNNHLYNYHYTTLKGLANSVDPCLTPIREMVRKVLRYTKIRPVTTELSSKHFVDYTDPMYEHGESFNTAWVLDELTGLPHVGYMEHRVSVARKPAEKIGIYWSAFGLDEIMKVVKKELMGTAVENLTNKNVQNVLMRAAQDMSVKKPVHVDICITLNGHVIVVHHYDENTFSKVIDDTSQIKQTMVGNFQGVIYDTLYEIQVPIDVGLQGVFTTKMPHLLSVKFNNIHTEVKKPSVNIKAEVDARFWRHGEYVMSVYNPIADVWHSVRRATTQDIALPIEMNFGYNHETKSVKVTMPRLPVTKLSHTGVRYYAKNLVTITEDEHDILKTCCATCQHHTVVSTGEKMNHHVAVDSKDMGLKYSMSIFDCENNVTPTTNIQEWHRVMSPEHKNTWNSRIVQYFMGIRQKSFNDYISPAVGSCGMVMKMEPSIVYPMSHIDMTLRVNVDDVDHIHDKIHTLNSKKINVRGTLDAKAASTNESVRTWDMNMNIDMSQGHIVNNVKIQMTRDTPGEQKLKICVDAQKNYPVTEKDPLKLHTTKEETNTKMTITAGFTDDDKCVRDDMLIVMTVKGEMTEEQKKQMTQDSMQHGSCIKDIRNPQFQTPQDHIPKTINCIRETVQFTTMRKYTVNTSYKKVPVSVLSHFAQIEDFIRASLWPHVKYITDRTESGNAKVVIEFLSDVNHINATVVTPVSGYEYVQVPLHQQMPLFEGMTMGEPMSQPWHFVMDNTRFSIAALHKMTQGQSKICTVYPKTLITLDEGVFPVVTSDKWTLVSGDYIDQTFAVFVKSMQDNTLAMKMYVGDHELKIVSDENNAVVTVDGNMVEQYKKGVVVPKDEPKSYAIKLTENNEHLVVQSQRVPMMMMWTPNSVTLMLDTVLQGRVTGMCGHMDNTHKEKLPKIYTLAHL